MPGPILWGPNDTANNLQLNLTQSGRYIGVGASLPWASGVNYQTNDLIVYSGNIYQCVISHPSSSFAADLAAGNWRLFNIDPINKNYIQIGSNFENALVSGWTAARSSSMTNNFPSSVGTGGNAFSSTNGGTTATTAIAPAVTGTNPLDGDFSLVFETTGSGATAGDMYISQAYEIDLSDQAKVLQFKFAYDLVQDTSSSNTNFSGTTSNTFGVAIYDLVNNAWIQPAGVFNFVQKSGVGYCTGTFQTSYNMTKFQIAVYVANSAASTSQAIKLYLDDFYVGPQITQVGSPITDFQSFTPTINWSTNYTCTGNWRRIGDSAEFLVKIALSGAPLAASELTVNVPFGWQIDTTKLLTTVAGTAPTYGDGIGYDLSTTNLYLFRVQYWSATSVKVFYQSSSTGQESAVTTAVPPTWANGDTIIVRYCVPIVGWSSSLELSSSTDTRVIAARALSTNSGAWPTSDTVVNYATVTGSNVYDNAGAITTGASWKYTIPVSGFYKIKASHAGTTSGATTLILRIRKNGSSFQNATFPVNAAVSNIIVQAVGTNYFNAGDYIDIAAASSAATGTFVSSASDNAVEIERLSGPSAIAASETVACRYSNTSGQGSLTNNSTITITGWTKTYDTHDFFNETTGIATIPISGKYLIQVGYLLTSAANTVNTELSAQVIQAGSKASTLIVGSTFIQAAGTSALSASGANVIDCLAGDTLTVRLYHNTGLTRQLNTSGNYNYVAITRLGN